MPNWKELGEVPDSEDDDGFDSQNTEQWPQAELPGETNKKDIWDIPSSQEEQHPALPTSSRRPPRSTTPVSRPSLSQPSPASSPLSSLHSSQDLPSIEHLFSESIEPQSSKSPPRQGGGSPIPSGNISKTVVQGASPHPDSSGADGVTPSTPRSRSTLEQTLIQSQILGHDAEEEEARRVAARYERSLRARRPEQMRPYYTEMARFNNAWRTHGLRPVRFVNEEEPRQRREESTERDFEPGSQDSGPQQPTDESQIHESNEFAGGLLIPESSSPLRTSPLNNRGGPSSQAVSQSDTDSTSVDGDELPSLQDLAKRGKSRSGAKPKTKRKPSSPKSDTRKRRRTMNLVHGDSSPQPPPTFIVPPDSPGTLQLRDDTHQDVPNDAEKTTENTTSTQLASLPSHPVVVDSDSDMEDVRQTHEAQEDDAGSGSNSDSGSEVMNHKGRTIRGVLPASWLRLDQLSGRSKIQKKMNRRHWNRSPERENRRGMAQRRWADPGSAQDKLLFEDDSEEEAPPQMQQTTDDVFHNQTRLELQPIQEQRASELWSSDDGASVIEEDHVDPMLPTRKRQTKLADAFQAQPKRTNTTPMARNPSTKVIKQRKINASFNKLGDSRPATKPTPSKRTKKSQTRPRLGSNRQAGAAATKSRSRAPKLGVLDVIEPGAPRFLKIAARTARGRYDQGRAQPGRKNIQLATRSDHIDAMSVLTKWKTGSLKQRSSVSSARKSKQPRSQPRPLTERSLNGPRLAPRNPALSNGGPRKFTKQVSYGGHATYKTQDPLETDRSVRPSEPPDRRRASFLPDRPAQLETDDIREVSTASFHAGKKILDRLYRAKHGGSTIAGSVLSSRNHDPASAAPQSRQRVPGEPQRDISPSAESRPKQIRARKKHAPQRIDVDAPPYIHANDPLPTEHLPAQDTLPVCYNTEGSKLLGLRPFGTQYTHHFEAFPLPTGVYFHDSTLLGSGAVESAVSDDYNQRLYDSRPRASLTLGDQILRWGPWSAQVSSEIGVVLDYAADQLEKNPSDDKVPNAPTATGAANHLLLYVKDSLTFDVDTDAKSFVARIMEVTHGFNTRVWSYIRGQRSKQYACSLLGVYDSILLVTFLSLRICRGDPTMMSEQSHMEELMKNVALTLIKILSYAGMDTVRKVYGDLNNLQFRERGLREDTPAIHSWVLVLRLLDSAQIPRSSFWDVVQGALAPPNLLSSVDAREHEHLWENMFTLLPLVEFNNIGLLVAGQRHRALNDGWGLPQKLLKRVFQLYRENTRQSPSFNDYCRALVGRCHYLVQEWGWRRCSSVVGVIFDFFGSQNLAHLRNEEFFKSPRFLEELARGPSLEIEPEDKCFHIFLKLVALGIRKLREEDSIRDIRNLVARTVPNHDRQYLKEQNIHARDLAALRNHHDLLCTLYWAAPPDLRPPVSLIERLVVPASSHKEACLISLRAWNQLSRFIVATGEATTSFKPFNQWRNNFFQQMMHQHDSVASDIEQQLIGLSKDVSNSVSRDMINAMVSMNKAAVMDVLYLSSTSSLDVMGHAPDLEAATFALSTLQLQRVFKHFSAAPPELDWAILQVSLSTLSSFLSRVDQFKDDEESQQSESQILNSAQADDALLVLDHDLAASFFQMARCVISPRSRRVGNVMAVAEKAACIEQVVVLAARLGMRFINAGVMSLVDMFKPGKHGLFGDMPHKLGLDERRNLTLFVTTLLKQGFDDFSNTGITLCELWMLAIVKPHDYLAFENELAEQLILHGKDFVPDAVLGLAVSPDYNTNRDLFEFAVSSMRKSIRDAGPSLKKILLSEHKRTLQLVMDQIKGDLKAVSQDARQHPNYLLFVRSIISLIRAHGPDICTVDEYFYQISKEYSPSVQDPQLQVAGMVSYGLRLSEGDTRVAHQLFFFLINNFKVALMNDKSFEEVKMLAQGLQNPGILHFVLGKMLPAIIRAAAVETACFPLVDMYTQACYLLLDNDEAPPELGEDDFAHLRPTLQAVVDGMQELTRVSDQSNDAVHLIRQLLGLMNVVWPSLHVLSLSGAAEHGVDGIKPLLKECNSFTDWAESYIKALIEFPDFDVAQASLLNFQPRDKGRATNDPHVASFTENIIKDVRTNWIISGERLSIQAPGKGRSTPSTQSGQGIRRPTFDRGELLMDMYDRARTWNRWWERVFGSSRKHVDCAVSEIPVF